MVAKGTGDSIRCRWQRETAAAAVQWDGASGAAARDTGGGAVAEARLLSRGVLDGGVVH